MTPCPNCGKPVDPLRAPAVNVRDGKVIAFCSQECRTAAETKPTRVEPAKPDPARAMTTPAAAAKKMRTPVSGIPQSAVDFDSSPVIEIIHEPASGVVTSAADARRGHTPAPQRRAETDGAIQIADTGHLDDFVSYDDPGRRSRIWLIIALLLVSLAGVGMFLYTQGYLDGLLGRDQPAAAPVDKDAAPAPVAVDAPPPITTQGALDKARAALFTQLKSDSPRVQRLAASALARTGDAESIKLLVAQLDSETSQQAKLKIAYALARGGDKRGLEALVAAIPAKDRETKLEAGTRLALLGDKRAIGALENYLQYSQFRLGVAEQMAYLADPRAIEVLEKVRSDEKALPDERARAVVALGHAGRADVAPALHELLTDDRNNAFAASSLAALHDEAARPVLVKQLEFPSLSVQAARALRRLAPEAPVTENLAPLVAALESKKDTEQVNIAEALLLLAGPPAWSEHE